MDSCRRQYSQVYRHTRLDLHSYIRVKGYYMTDWQSYMQTIQTSSGSKVKKEKDSDRIIVLKWTCNRHHNNYLRVQSIVPIISSEHPIYSFSRW